MSMPLLYNDRQTSLVFTANLYRRSLWRGNQIAAGVVDAILLATGNLQLDFLGYAHSAHPLQITLAGFDVLPDRFFGEVNHVETEQWPAVTNDLVGEIGFFAWCCFSTNIKKLLDRHKVERSHFLWNVEGEK
jgi:hypothetical protein